jgi:hypothetical protein
MQNGGKMNNHILAINTLGVKNQLLIGRCLDLGRIYEAKQLQKIDCELIYLLKQKRKALNFVSYISTGKILLVGDGNLSFAYSLMSKPKLNPKNITATIFEKQLEISDETSNNASKLRSKGFRVLYGVDAGKLGAIFGQEKFESIIFQFPHAGSREPINGHNPNYILIKKFLKSAKKQLAATGSILISAVDTPHYHGAFHFEQAAEETGFQPPEIYKFDPSDFQGYTHTMTHQDGSVLDEHNSFATWIFKPK